MLTVTGIRFQSWKVIDALRLFISAELPLELVEAMGETIAVLRDCVRGRFVAPQNLHVTLAFLGEVSASRVADVACVMGRACAQRAPISCHLVELGSFGRERRSVLWQGVESSGGLEELAAVTRTELAQEGFVFDEKPFRAHVTLMRNVDLSQHVVLPTACEASGFVERVSLFRSYLSEEGASYESLETVLLA